MKKEVILVPKGKCPIDVLAEMGERINHAWIFLHKNAYDMLKSSDGVEFEKRRRGCCTLTWEATEDYPKTEISLYCGIIIDSTSWVSVRRISAVDITFRQVDDPEDIFFLQMEE